MKYLCVILTFLSIVSCQLVERNPLHFQAVSKTQMQEYVLHTLDTTPCNSYSNLPIFDRFTDSINSELQFQHQDTLLKISELISGYWRHEGYCCHDSEDYVPQLRGSISDTVRTIILKEGVFEVHLTAENKIKFFLPKEMEIVSLASDDTMSSKGIGLGFFEPNSFNWINGGLSSSTCNSFSSLVFYKGEIGLLLQGMFDDKFLKIKELSPSRLILETPSFDEHYLKVQLWDKEEHQ